VFNGCGATGAKFMLTCGTVVIGGKYVAKFCGVYVLVAGIGTCAVDEILDAIAGVGWPGTAAPP
jgi:hypothetical protein